MVQHNYCKSQDWHNWLKNLAVDSISFQSNSLYYGILYYVHYTDYIEAINTGILSHRTNDCKWEENLNVLLFMSEGM